MHRMALLHMSEWMFHTTFTPITWTCTGRLLVLSAWKTLKTGKTNFFPYFFSKIPLWHWKWVKVTETGIKWGSVSQHNIYRTVFWNSGELMSTISVTSEQKKLMWPNPNQCWILQMWPAQINAEILPMWPAQINAEILPMWPAKTNAEFSNLIDIHQLPCMVTERDASETFPGFLPR